MTEQERAELDRLLIEVVDPADEEAWCAAYLSVRTKQGALVAAAWGPAQRKLFEGIAKQRARGQAIRIVYLKARQVYVSTGTAMKFWKDTAFIAGQRAQVYAHDDDSAQRIYEYYERFNDSYTGPQPLPAVTRRNRADGIVYANGSAVEVRTAGSVKGGRSRTTRRLHLSEYAFWPDAGPLMTGLLQSVPDDPDTMVVIESTANGMGGPFYDLWIAANRGENDYLPIFFAWWEHPEYARALEQTVEQFDDSLDTEEVRLRQAHGLTHDQLNWRRWCIRNKCEGKAERFKQEYPATPEEAFQASGRMRIPSWVIEGHKAKTPELIGELRIEQRGTREQVVLIENPTGCLSVWQEPEPNHYYAIGADAAEGQDANEGLGNTDPDFSVGDVFGYPVGLQVAQVRERLTPAEFGHYLYALGRWYNWALIGLEVNGPGAGTLQVLLDRQYPMDRLCRRVAYDDNGRPIGSKIGFKVTAVNREQIISGYENALANPGDGGIILRSYISINEVYTFHVLKGKAQAIAGRHDDTIFSGAHGVEALKQAAAVFGRAVKDPESGARKPMRYAVSMREQLRRSYNQ